MNAIHYIGLDVHKKTIAYCVKTADGQIVEEGTLQAQRAELRRWAKRRQVAWQGAMEATLFSAWIYDTLKPYAQQLSMGHRAKMKAITAGRRRAIVSMHVPLPTCCGAICCLPATCCRRICAICDVCCVIET